MAVPLMDHPSESFLAQLEEDMMKLILKHGMMVGTTGYAYNLIMLSSSVWLQSSLSIASYGLLLFLILSIFFKQENRLKYLKMSFWGMINGALNGSLS